MSGQKSWLWTVAVLGSMVGAGVFSSGQAVAMARGTSPSNVEVHVAGTSPVFGGATRLGAAATAIPLHLDVVLKPRDPSALAGFATAVSTPNSPLYRHFLPKGQLARDFGPMPATVAAVRDALRNAGFKIGPVSANGLVIPVTTTVGRAESGLHTQIASYRLSSGRTAIANTVSPSLPSSIASSVQAIVGLNTTVQAQPQSFSAGAVAPGPEGATQVTADQSGSGPTPCGAAAAEATASHSYTIRLLVEAYDFTGLYDAGDFGSGATVALMELEPFAASDVSSFQTCYATSVPVTTTKVDGGAGQGPGSGEAALDIENVIELAPEADVEVYEAPNNDRGVLDDYATIASTDTAQVVSTSWGLCEAFDEGSMSAESTIFEEMTAQGQTVFAASGDTGSEGCLPKSGTYTVRTGIHPDALVADSGTGTVYVANQGSNSISVESESGLAPAITASSGSDPDAVAVDPVTHDVYVADGTSPGAVTVLPGATCDASVHSDCTATTIPDLGDVSAGIAVDPTDGTAYVTDEGSGTVSVISEATDSVAGTVTLGSGTSPLGIAVDTAAHAVYVTDSGSDTVSVIDGTGCNATLQTGCGATPPTIPVGDGPRAVAVNSVTGTAYVVDTLSSELSVINGSTGTVSRTVDVSGNPTSVALSPSGGQLLVVGPDVNSQAYGVGNPTKRELKGFRRIAVVVSTTSDTVAAVLATDKSPEAVAVDPTTGYAFTADATGGGYAGQGDMGVLPLFLDVDDPGSQPDVTDVGGTDLEWSQNAQVESAWSGNGLASFGAGGGGISSVFPMPSYQSGVVNAQSSGTPCGAPAGDDCREVPDVSASADPYDGYVIFYDGAWRVFGGTSGAAPVWAAVTALAVTFNGTVERLGNINPDLYAFAAKGYPDFTDITEGNNDYTTTNAGAYAAGPGYDMATGLGSPRASVLAPDLDPFVISAEPTSQTVVAGQDASFTVATTGTPAPTVQWEVSTDGGDTFVKIPDATADTYSVTATPAENGNEFEAVITNPIGSISTTAATLNVFSIITTSLPDATRGAAYRFQLEAAGGPTPYSWTYAGALPKGLKLASTGLLSGKPKLRNVKSGTYTVTVTVTTPASTVSPSLTFSQTLVLTLL